MDFRAFPALRVYDCYDSLSLPCLLALDLLILAFSLYLSDLLVSPRGTWSWPHCQAALTGYVSSGVKGFSEFNVSFSHSREPASQQHRRARALPESQPVRQRDLGSLQGAETAQQQ